MKLLPPALAALVAAALASVAGAQTDLRAWHADGQTWIVWRDNQSFSAAESWSVYRSDAPITDLADAQLSGRAYPEDAIGTVLWNATPGDTWTVPHPSGTGTYALAADEALFVYTPRVAAPEYFAVVKTGDSVVTVDNTDGPVLQTLDPVVPHVQATGLDAGHPFTLYSVWIDGDADETAGRPDFGVFGPASLRGMARMFCIFEPTGGPPPSPSPAVAFLHGGGGNYWNYRPSKSGDHRFDVNLEGGLYVTFDDRMRLRTPSTVPDDTMLQNSRWFGQVRGFDRFAPQDVVPPDDDVVVDFDQRWLDWALDWLVAERDVDASRIAFMGLSGGGRGSVLYARTRPERVAAVTAFVMGVDPTLNEHGTALFGTHAQNLRTVLPGRPRILDVMDPKVTLGDEDLPFLRLVDGTGDDLVPWDLRPDVYEAFDDARIGAAIYWDDREHTAGGGGWDTAWFVGSPRHDAAWLLRYRNDRSFPALSRVDHDLATSGPQPDPGDPVLPANGDPHGTRGGWLDWAPASIVDEPHLWSADIGLVTGSPFAHDNAPLSFARADVTIRRPQSFQPAPGEPLLWSAHNTKTGTLLASGLLSVGRDGVVTIPRVVSGASPVHLRVVRILEAGMQLPL